MLIRPASLALAAGLALGVPAASATPDQPVAAEHVSAPVKAPQQSQDDASQYAQREQHNKQAAQYQGGDVLIVGVSGAAIVLLLLLLILI
jgi:hypothetical protein